MQSEAENKVLCIVPINTTYLKKKKKKTFGKPPNRLEEKTKENTRLPQQTLERNSLEQKC